MTFLKDWYTYLSSVIIKTMQKSRIELMSVINALIYPLLHIR
jgi:hypothetical protein